VSINHDPAWLKCKQALQSAVRVDCRGCEAWLARNKQFAAQQLLMRYFPGMEGILIGDIIEQYVGFHVDPRLPNPDIARRVPK